MQAMGGTGGIPTLRQGTSHAQRAPGGQIEIVVAEDQVHPIQAELDKARQRAGGDIQDEQFAGGVDFCAELRVNQVQLR